MIDTIRLRLHGVQDIKKTLQSQINTANGKEDVYWLPVHNELYRKILQWKGKHFSSRVIKTRQKYEISELTDEQFMSLHYSKVMNEHLQVMDLMTFTDENKQKTIYKRINGKYEVPSSHHGVTFDVDPEKGYIDFQCSIPKYLFGHSLAQFVPQIHSELYEQNYFRGHKWSWQQKHIYKRLLDFVDRFFGDLEIMFSLDGPISKSYVEVTRIDLCFNQYFESKEMALKTLENLKLINNRRYKKHNKAPHEYKTSLTYQNNDGSYFKIYHKGTEYSESVHGDLKKHMDVNKSFMDKLNYTKSAKKMYIENKDLIHGIFNDVGKDGKIIVDPGLKEKIKPFVYGLSKKVPFKVDFFKKEMDKVLRYEVSIKGKYLTYLYKYKVFRKDCPVHNAAFAEFKKVKSIYDSRNTQKNEIKVTKRQNANYKMFNKHLKRKTSLVLSNNEYLKRFETNGQIDFDERNMSYDITAYDMNKTDLAHNDVGIFGEDMLKFCVKHFYKLVMYYQVKKIKSYDDLTAQITKYNLDVDKRVEEYNHENVRLTYNHLGQRRIKGNKVITKATQLLTRKELIQKGLKKVTPMTLITVIGLLKKGKSMTVIRNDLGMSPSQYSRLKDDLKIFDISEQSLFESQKVETCTDFKEYYNKCETNEYLNKFFIELKHRNYG